MRSLIAGNWKMHGTAPQLREIDAIAAAVHAVPPAADILLCLPATVILLLHAHFSDATRHRGRLAKLHALETRNIQP